jgi:hypothetical protein
MTKFVRIEVRRGKGQGAAARAAGQVPCGPGAGADKVTGHAVWTPWGLLTPEVRDTAGPFSGRCEDTTTPGKPT